MKNFFLTVTILFCATANGQNYRDEFLKYHTEKDTLKQIEILERWEKEKPNDAELFVSYFNYYFAQAKQEYINFTQEQPQGEALEIVDSLGNKWYLGSQIYFNEEMFEKGIEKIDEGIKLFPNRLDMRFGKVYTFGQVEDWERFTKEIIKTIQYSKINNNKWTWTNNKKVDGDGKDFMLSSIQDYQMQLFNTEADSLCENMRKIAEEILKLYPNHIQSLSNIAITYFILEKNYDKALEYLFKAEKINAKDAVVLNNIAYAYRYKGEKQQSIKYYEKVIKYGNERQKNNAKYYIKELKGK